MELSGNISNQHPISGTQGHTPAQGVSQIHGVSVSQEEYGNACIMNLYIMALHDSATTGLQAMVAIQGRQDDISQFILKLSSDLSDFKLVPISKSTGSNQGNISNQQINNQITIQKQTNLQSSLGSVENRQSITSSLGQEITQRTSTLTEQFNSSLGQIAELTLTMCLAK